MNPETPRVPGESACSGHDLSWDEDCLTFPLCRPLLLTAESGLGEVVAEVTPIANLVAHDSFPESFLFDPILQFGTGGGGGSSWTRLVGSGISSWYLAEPGIHSKLPIQ